MVNLDMQVFHAMHVVVFVAGNLHHMVNSDTNNTYKFHVVCLCEVINQTITLLNVW